MRSPRRGPSRSAVTLFAVMSLLAPPSARAQAQLEHLILIAPAAPGGGWDQTARAMQHALLAEGIVRVVEVQNIPGAAGTIGLAHFVSDDKGREDTVLVMGLVMLAAILWNDSPATLAGVTPLAGLTGEPEVIAVPAGSPHRDMASLLAALRANPAAVSWGGGSAGGTDHLLAGLILASAGVEPGRVNYIAFSGGGEAVTALLGGNVTAGVNGYSEVAAHVESGRLRALAISTQARVPGIPAPTLREQGIDVDMMNWRGVVAAPGLSLAQRDRLLSVMSRMVRSPTWRRTLEEREWTDMYLASDAFDAFLWSERARVDRIVRRLQGGSSAAPARGTDWMFPLGIGVAAVVVAFLLARQRVLDVARARVHARRDDGSAAAEMSQADLTVPLHDRRSLIWVCAGLGGYVAAMSAGGFVVASTILFSSVAGAFGSRRTGRDVLIGLGLSVAVFVVFTRGLGLQLPGGVLAAWIR